MHEEIVDPSIATGEDSTLDLTLRPESLEEYFVNGKLKSDLYRNLKVFLKAARDRSEALEHVLFYGPPGLGKTTLSYILANELDSNVKITSGPAIERAGDLVSILTNMKDRDLLFIDEIHRLNKVIEETMYPAMENFEIDIILGKGPSARSVRLDLPKVTIVGATTRIGMMSAPLRDRFGMHYRLEFYEPQELQYIVRRAAQLLSLAVNEDAALEIASRSRGTPRIANRLLRRVRDYAQVHAINPISIAIVHDALDMLDVDRSGLTEQDRKYLRTMAEQYAARPVGIETLAASMSEDRGTLEEVVEPFLLQSGYVERTPRGRKITQKGLMHIGRGDLFLASS